MGMQNGFGPMCIKVIDICVGKSIEVSSRVCDALRFRRRSLCSTPAGFIWPPAAQSGREHKCVWLVASAIHGAQHKTLAKTRLSRSALFPSSLKKGKSSPLVSFSRVCLFVQQKSTFSRTFVV